MLLTFDDDIGIIGQQERERMKMDSKTIAKELGKLGYTLKRTSDVEARWMVRSNVLTYHWNFKDLYSVQRFMVDEKAMYRYARSVAPLRK